MDLKQYNKKVLLAFDGTGGGIVFRNYLKAAKSDDTLQEVIDEIKHDFSEFPEDFDNDTRLFDIVPKNTQERISFINAFLGEKCSSPEMCGAVAGILFKSGKLQEVLEFLEIDDMDEPRYWDS